MGQEHDDFADLGPGPSRSWPRWLRTLVFFLAATAVFGVGIAGAAAFFVIRDHFAD